MRIIANAGPLMALGKIRLIHLLHALYEEVLIPLAVYEEVVLTGLEWGYPDAYDVNFAISRGEVRVVSVNDDHLPESLRDLPLGRGEKQVLYLGLREKADWVLIDDMLAREEASRLGLKVKGTLGVIVEGYYRGVITLGEIEAIFQSIIAREDIWISEALIRRVWDELIRR